jgi:hypothetical protein
MIKRMIKRCPTESDAKASERVPGLLDDQGASDGKSDGKASRVRLESTRHPPTSDRLVCYGAEDAAEPR